MKLNLNIPLQALLCFFLATLLLGCEKKQSNLWKQQHALLDEQDKLYQAYLTADVYQARQILQQKVKLFENDTILERSGLARDLFQEFSRLYAFDKRVGNNDSAEVDLIKAHFWLVRDFELGGLSSDKVMEKVRTANADDILAMVDKQDKMASNGKGPKYIQDVIKDGPH